MAVRVADNLKPANDSTEFPVAYGSDIWLDKNKGSGTPNYASIQSMLNNDELGNGGSAIQVDLLPHPSVDELGKIYEFIGSTGTYVNGYFYECVSDGESTPTYSWVQKNVQPSNATATDVSYDNTTSELVATNVQDAIDEIKGGLGTASGKDSTDLVRPNSHELVESGSVYSAINNALSSIYTPRGELTCAELTSSLLIEDNVGNIYTMSDSGTTSALFINGAGLTINIGDNVGIIKAGADTYLFNYMGNAFDLTDYQKKDLSSPIAGASTVEGAIAQNTSDIEKIKAYTAVSNTDANTLTTTGLYYLTTGCTNIPSAYCILQVQSKNTTSISDDIAQYTVNTEGDQYYRVRVNGTWSSWKKLATEEYVDSICKNIQNVYNGATYTTDTALIEKIVEDVKALAESGKNVGGSISAVWTGKSFINGNYSVYGSSSGFIYLDFENATSNGTHCQISLNGSSTYVTWSTPATTDDLIQVTLFSGDLNTLVLIGVPQYKKYYGTPTSITANAPTVVFDPRIYYIDIWQNAGGEYYQKCTVVGLDWSDASAQNKTFVRSCYFNGTNFVWANWTEELTTSNLTSAVTQGSTAPITSGGVYEATVKRYPTENLYPVYLGLPAGTVALQDLCDAINTTLGSNCCIRFAWDSSNAIALDVNGTIVSLSGSVLQGHFEPKNTPWRLSEGWFTDEEGNMYSFRCRTQEGTTPNVVIKKLS